MTLAGFLFKSIVSPELYFAMTFNFISDLRPSFGTALLSSRVSPFTGCISIATDMCVCLQLPAVVQKLRDRKWKVGELLHMLIRYCEESQSHSQAGRELHGTPLFQWLLEHT